MLEVSREAGSESLRSGVIVHVLSKGLCTQSCVCDASVQLHWLCLEVQRRLLCQAEAVAPKRIKPGFGCNGLGCSRSGSSRSVSSFSSPGYVRDSGFSSFSILGLRLQDVAEPDVVLMSWRFKQLTTVSPVSLSAAKRIVPAAKESS